MSQPTLSCEFTLEVITPLFLGGADQQPEVRPASVRGALRYWLRAGLSSVLGDNQITEMSRFERSIFGSTDASSPIVVRFLEDDQVKSVNRYLLPHREQGSAACWPEKKKFRLVLSLAPSGKLQPNACDLLESATWATLLWLTLGGSGRRSRRSAGSFKVLNASLPDKTFSKELSDCAAALQTTATDANTLAQLIGALVTNALDSFRKMVAPGQSPDFRSYPDHPVLRDKTRITVWTPGIKDLNASSSALSKLMNKMSATNQQLGSNFYKAFGGAGNNRRFASPLHVSAYQLSNQWAFVMTYLGSETWQENGNLHTEVKDFFDTLGNTTEAFGGSNE